MIIIIMILNLMIIFHEIIVPCNNPIRYVSWKYMRANKKAVTTPPCGGRKGVCHCAPFPIIKEDLRE